MSVNRTCRAATDASIDVGLLEEPMCLNLDPSSHDIHGPRSARTQSSGNPESTRGQAGLANVAAERAKEPSATSERRKTSKISKIKEMGKKLN